jgi:hypothetical protein
MTIYKAKGDLVMDWPCLKVYDRKPKTTAKEGAEYIEIDHEDILFCGGHTYTAGSVFSYALERGECPLEAYEKARVLGHETHWISQRHTVLSSHVEPREAVNVWHGAVVKFQGKFFWIDPAPNDNLRLKPHDWLD